MKCFTSNVAKKIHVGPIVFRPGLERTINPVSTTRTHKLKRSVYYSFVFDFSKGSCQGFFQGPFKECFSTLEIIFNSIQKVPKIFRILARAENQFEIADSFEFLSGFIPMITHRSISI